MFNKLTTDLINKIIIELKKKKMKKLFNKIYYTLYLMKLMHEYIHI